MKKVFIVILAACLVAALCGWTFKPGKKSFGCDSCPNHSVASGVSSSAGLSGEVVHDDCKNKCSIYLIHHKDATTGNKCGKCGGSMESKKTREDDKYWYETYTCKKDKCKHQCEVKWKY